MNMINVTRMIKGKEKEIVRDLKDMYARKIIHSALFAFTLVPEGDPAADKASELAENFLRYRQELGDCDMPVGILIQATMGHGWVPAEEASFTRFHFYDGTSRYIFCPKDEQFRAHIYSQVRILSRLKADFFMIDDDTRMYTGRRDGCFCPLHLAEFNLLNNSDFSAQELHDAIASDENIARKWDELQFNSIAEFCAGIRKEMSAENPDIPGMFCACSGDIRHAVKIAAILAAPGQKPVIRLNHSRYFKDSPRTWIPWTQKTALQIAAVPDDYTILAETDTFPHGRYSTAGVVLHSQYSWALLAGCSGGKLWITGAEGPERGSGPYYRKMLAENDGFYQQISLMRPEYSGIVEPLPQEAPFNLVTHTDGVVLNTWATSVFAYLGVPFSYEKNPPPGRMVALSAGIEFFSDAELEKFFAGDVLLSGEAAIALTRRGFGKYMGLTASEWYGPAAVFELLDGERLPRVHEAAVLEHISPKAEIISDLYHSITIDSPAHKLSPGMVRFKNEAGGTVITSALFLHEFSHESFGMFHPSRKANLLRLIDFGISYPEDAPLHLTVFRDRGVLTLAAVNLGLDMMYELPLSGVPESIRGAEMLCPDGSWQSVPLENNSVKVTIPPQQIVFIRLI